MKETYKYFTLKDLDTTAINKFALMSLLGYATSKWRIKYPVIEAYQVLQSIIKEKGKESHYPDQLIYKVGIICDDLMKDETEFELFGCKDNNEVKDRIIYVLDQIKPFNYPTVGEDPGKVLDDLPF